MWSPLHSLRLSTYCNQMKASAPPRSSVQSEPTNGRSVALHHSSSVQSVKEKEKELQSQKRDLGPCWANLMSSDGQNNERITLRSRLISHSQQGIHIHNYA